MEKSALKSPGNVREFHSESDHSVIISVTYVGKHVQEKSLLSVFAIADRLLDRFSCGSYSNKKYGTFCGMGYLSYC